MKAEAGLCQGGGSLVGGEAGRKTHITAVSGMWAVGLKTYKYTPAAWEERSGRGWRAQGRGQGGCSIATDIYENIIMKPITSYAN